MARRIASKSRRRKSLFRIGNSSNRYGIAGIGHIGGDSFFLA